MQDAVLQEESRAEQLIRAYLASNAVSFQADDLAYEDGSHVIHGMTLSEELQNDEERMQAFYADLPDLIELLCAVDPDPRLQIPKKAIPGRLWPYFRGEDVTGITMLLLFSHDMLRLEREGADTLTLYAEQSLLRGLPEAETVLKALVKDLLAFSHEQCEAVRILPYRRSRTVACTDELEVTYLLDDEFESRFGDAEKILPSRDARIEHVRRNRQDTLDRLSALLRSMDPKNAAGRKRL